MTEAKTLLQLAGADLAPARIPDACLVLIDLQNEYLEGPIAVLEAGVAIASAAQLLMSARKNGTPVFHIAHKAGPEACSTERPSAVRSLPS
jgi:nicotinamidase-related amidase